MADRFHCCCAGVPLCWWSHTQALEVWSLQSGKRVQSFSYESKTPQINCVVYNHNGNMLVSGGADGMIRVFDMGKNVPLMGWPAHDSGQLSSVRFSSDETSIISTGLDGVIAEWSLHRVGKLVRSYKIPHPLTYRTNPVVRCELAVDSDAEFLLLSSSNAFNSALIWSVASGRTLPAQAISAGHSGPVLTVDWHPAAHHILTGSADHTARLITLRRRPPMPTSVTLK
jgi:WD repeat-containing protein 91